jgi:hypothetical protein
MFIIESTLVIGSDMKYIYRENEEKICLTAVLSLSLSLSLTPIASRGQNSCKLTNS